MFRKLLVSAMLIAGSTSANAALLFSEDFDDINTLGGADWLAGNFGTGGATADTWFQGNSGIFDAQAGAADSYIASNYLSAGFGGNVDNWLVTPLIAAFGSYHVLLLHANRGWIAWRQPGAVLQQRRKRRRALGLRIARESCPDAGYPINWQVFDFVYGGADGNVRFAFRYTVTDTSANGDYIGIDSVSVSVPEPATMLLLGSGLLLMPLTMRRRRREQR